MLRDDRGDGGRRPIPARNVLGEPLEICSFKPIYSTPAPEFGFPGLKPGDRWCLCAPRWQEALEANQAPRVVLRATHESALTYCKLASLKRLAVDLA